MRAGVIFTFTIICAAIAWVDIQKQKIYNEAVAVLLVPAIVSFFVFPEVSAVSRISAAISVSGIMLMAGLISPGAFGGGDIKMMVPVGLFLGMKRTLVAGMIALVLEGIWTFWILLKSVHAKRGREGENRDVLQNLGKKQIAFGPALCMGSIAALLWSDGIWCWLSRI